MAHPLLQSPSSIWIIWLNLPFCWEMHPVCVIMDISVTQYKEPENNKIKLDLVLPSQQKYQKNSGYEIFNGQCFLFWLLKEYRTS